MNIDGVQFRFIETAGILETSDAIETIGIERSFQKLDQASIVLWVVDSTEAKAQIDTLKDKVIPRCEGKKLILVMNKCDVTPNHDIVAKENICFGEDDCMETISISAKNRKGIAELQKLLVRAAALPEVTQNDVVVSNVRHYEALSHALEAIHRVQDGMTMGLSGDLVSQDLRECLFHLAEIVGGEITNDEVLGNIFRNFCIGK